MHDVATWVGNAVMVLGGVAALCGMVWGVTELAWWQVKRVEGFATVVYALRNAKRLPSLTSVEPDGWVIRLPNGDEDVTGWPPDDATKVEPVFSQSTLEKQGIARPTAPGVPVAGKDQP